MSKSKGKSKSKSGKDDDDDAEARDDTAHSTQHQRLQQMMTTNVIEI